MGIATNASWFGCAFAFLFGPLSPFVLLFNHIKCFLVDIIFPGFSCALRSLAFFAQTGCTSKTQMLPDLAGALLLKHVKCFLVWLAVCFVAETG